MRYSTDQVVLIKNSGLNKESRETNITPAVRKSTSKMIIDDLLCSSPPKQKKILNMDIDMLINPKNNQYVETEDFTL